MDLKDWIEAYRLNSDNEYTDDESEVVNYMIPSYKINRLIEAYDKKLVRQGIITKVDHDTLSAMSKEELVSECIRRSSVTKSIWSLIASEFGQIGFIRILSKLDNKKLY